MGNKLPTLRSILCFRLPENLIFIPPYRAVWWVRNPPYDCLNYNFYSHPR
ncbi:MAG: hypothetical protein IKZ88_07730 [Neisseriaceae bacterium]|nr:hypothetical protein [Neisseriaceae bacterium]